jgi:predicted ester cyclase
MAGQADSERNMNMTAGGSPGTGGNIAPAGDLLSENVRTNGALASVAGPKRRIQERPAGFRHLTTTIEDMFSASDKIVTCLVHRGTDTGPYGGVNAAGKPAEIRDFAMWRFEDGKVAEIATIQDRFARLRQIGYLPGGSIRSSRRTSAEHGVTSQVVRMSQVAARPGL